jgi:hypothetical protein
VTGYEGFTNALLAERIAAGDITDDDLADLLGLTWEHKVASVYLATEPQRRLVGPWQPVETP